MAAEISPERFARVVAALEGTETARYLVIASFTLLVYDYAITLDKEVSP